jgi:hypothetical protein
MNTKTINLSSNTTNGTEVLPEIMIYDKTILNVSLSGIPEDIIPIGSKFTWGDGEENIILNDINKDYSIDSIFPEILEGKLSKLFSQSVSHIYYPSPNTLYLSLTAQIDINYPVNDILTFILPLKIRKNSFLENFEDVDLTNTRFVEGLNREYHFSGKIGNASFEMVTES